VLLKITLPSACSATDYYKGCENCGFLCFISLDYYASMKQIMLNVASNDILASF
jgi:hypothetical protein